MGTYTLVRSTPRPDPSGGLENVFRDIDLDETAVAIKASAGNIYWFFVINVASSPIYVQFYDAAAADVTVGTTTPKATFGIPSQGDANGSAANIPIHMGIQFDTAITAACTTTPGGAAGPGANECVINVGYE